MKVFTKVVKCKECGMEIVYFADSTSSIKNATCLRCYESETFGDIESEHNDNQDGR